MRLLAIDPGPEESAWVHYDTERGQLVNWGKVDNTVLLNHLAVPADLVAIEMIASYGMPVGAEVFETCVWIGRFSQAWGQRRGSLPLRVFRRDVKLHLCQSARAKDANVRQALIDRFGPGKELAIGRKANPGPLYGLAGDGWAALGVAVTVADQLESRAVAA